MAKKSILGLDIGSKFIKALELTQLGENEYRIDEFGIVEVSPQVAIPDALGDLFSRKRFQTKRVVSAVSGRFVFVRYINMPVMTDEELVNAAKYELGKYIPVEVDEVLHDSQKLEELAPQEGQEPEMRVLLVAAKRTFVDEHVAVLEAAGLQSAVVDVDAFSLGNAYELAGQVNPQAIPQGKMVALVDIGASKTTINIMSDTMSYFTREFYKGGNDLTEAISKRLALESHEAEMMKRSSTGQVRGPLTSVSPPSVAEPIVLVDVGDADKLKRETAMRSGQERAPFSDENAAAVEEAVAGVIDDICHDINISIDYFENQYDRRVDQVYVLGGTSNYAGLQEALARTIQKPVAKWNPLQHFDSTRLSKESLQEIEETSAQAVIALGLASRVLG